MTSTRAYALREEYDADTFGGSVTLGDGTAFDVAASLDLGGGVIVTDDEGLIVALDAYPALKRVAVPEGQGGYDSLKKDDLEKLASDRGVEIPDNATKAQIIDALQNADSEGDDS